MPYILLALAIVTEVGATQLLKASAGWTKLWFGFGAILLYCASALFFGYALKHISVGLAYAIWCGVGIVLACIAAVVLWDQSFDIPAGIGIALIMAGVVVITWKSSVVLQ
jgi:small multidrug resistance pump